MEIEREVLLATGGAGYNLMGVGRAVEVLGVELAVVWGRQWGAMEVAYTPTNSWSTFPVLWCWLGAQELDCLSQGSVNRPKESNSLLLCLTVCPPNYQLSGWSTLPTKVLVPSDNTMIISGGY